MNTADILKNGHQTVLQTIEGFPEGEWDTPGVCGVWSAKEIMAHLASFEHLLVDVLNSLLDGGPTPTLDRVLQGFEQFNDDEVEARRDKSAVEVVAEYTETCTQAADLMAQIPPEQRLVNGSLPWYGQEYSLNDFIVYTFYGHKREHAAQIAVFRDRLNGKD